MTIPKPKTEVVHAKEFRKDPKPVKGYYIDKESVTEGVNRMGYRYQFYQMVKAERKQN